MIFGPLANHHFRHFFVQSACSASQSRSRLSNPLSQMTGEHSPPCTSELSMPKSQQPTFESPKEPTPPHVEHVERTGSNPVTSFADPLPPIRMLPAQLQVQLPPQWDSLNANQQSKWLKRHNPLPPTESPLPTTATSQAPKPSNWGSMSPKEKSNWRHKHK